MQFSSQVFSSLLRLYEISHSFCYSGCMRVAAFQQENFKGETLGLLAAYFFSETDNSETSLSTTVESPLEPQPLKPRVAKKACSSFGVR